MLEQERGWAIGWKAVGTTPGMWHGQREDGEITEEGLARRTDRLSGSRDGGGALRKERWQTS